MATATVARPTQALRQRRDAPRPSLAKRQTNMDAPTDGAPSKKRKLNEPYVRDSQYVLRKHNSKPPSLIIHLHETHFRFDGQDGSFPYDSPMRFVLEHIKRQTVPHQMMEELLANNVPFYDGCLIVEIHNHKTQERKEKGRNDSGAGGTVKFSMHNYNVHVTPSPMLPYPSKARTEGMPEKVEASSSEMPAPEKPKEKDGPKIHTVVLHPTELTRHYEMLILMETPAADARSGKKRSADGATPSSAQPPTPSLSVPPTPILTSRGSLSQSQKMCIEEGDLYSFQAELLVATEPPLYLEPAKTPQESQKIVDMLQHPLHQAKPPSPKTRKRTTAEMAADDAQAAETERRMLIMDERIKATGTSTAANENQAAAASLGFSRFKTIDMVRQKHEEQERIKKDEEARAAVEKKHQEEQAAQQLKMRREMIQMQQNKQPSVQQQQVAVLAQQQEQRQRNASMNAQRQAQMNAQNHAHPNHSGMVPNQQNQPNYQHPNQNVVTQQGSPIARNLTPMINSSPLAPQNGFPMVQTSSQGAGSPQRPTSALMHHPPAGMVRQVSQQQHSSRNATPQMPQGTPIMASAMPNRQTPRVQPGSPLTGMQQGTPTPATMNLQTPQMNNQGQLTAEQITILTQRRAMSQGQPNPGMPAGSTPPNMTPEQFQQIKQQRMQQQWMAQAQAHNHGVPLNPAQTQAVLQRHKLAMQKQMMLNHQQQNGQVNGSPVQAGAPGSMTRQTPQIAHAHPQQQGTVQDPNQMTPQQQRQQQQQQQHQQQQQQQQQQQHQHQHQQMLMAQARAQQQQQQQLMQQELQPLLHQYGNINNIPHSLLPPAVRQYLNVQRTRQQQMARNRQFQLQHQAQVGGGELVPGAPPNPHYMQQIRNNQAMSARPHAQMPNQQGGSGVNGMPNMPFNLKQSYGNPGSNEQSVRQLAETQTALNRSQQQQQ